MQNKCTALSTLPLPCLGLVSRIFFSVFHYSLSLQCAFSSTALVLIPRDKSDPRLGSSLALTWKYLACPGIYIKWAAKKEMFPYFFTLSVKERKIISFVDETAKYSNTSSCCNLLFHCQCTENCCWRLLVWLEILVQLSKTLERIDVFTNISIIKLPILIEDLPYWNVFWG